MLGAHDAGKTTLLVGTWLELLKGRKLAGATFAGSRTLGAWEGLAAWTRFDDAARAPSFPPHTERGTGRAPGMLHLALCHGDALRDVLLADAPGEWFTAWSEREDAASTAGARWVVEHADVFLVVADSDRLSGEKRGEARHATRQLIERLRNHVGERPVVLVWTKADKTVPEGIRGAIRRALAELPQNCEASATVDQPATLAAAVEVAIERAWLPPRAPRFEAPVVRQDPFAAFRGHHEAP